MIRSGELRQDEGMNNSIAVRRLFPLRRRTATCPVALSAKANPSLNKDWLLRRCPLFVAS